MSRTLTGLVPTIYTALDQVSRELIGFIPNVAMSASAEEAAVNQTVRAPVTTQGSLEDITPGNTPADSGDQTLGYVDVTITKSKAYPIRWTGEEQLSISRYGEYNTILADEFTQAFRTLANAVETDLAGLYKSVARAVGTAGTTPFATADNHTDFANSNQLLDELGAPQSDRIMILGSTARAKLEGIQSGLFKVNEAGDGGAMLRNREQRMIHGFTMGYSAGVGTHTKGTGSGYLTDLVAGYAVGDTDIHVDTGTGAILAGDVVTWAGDTSKYVIGTGFAGDGDGDIALNDPGLVVALDDGDALTIGNSYVYNMFYHRNALLLAARAPAMPEGGDAADDVMTFVDPLSGLNFQVAIYRQYRRVKYEVGLAWGVAAPNGKHAGILMG